MGGKFHAMLSDPPYDLNFMGKDWDKSADYKVWGQALLPHLYPGALCLMFGGTRTWHRLAAGMEDAGFEMIDTLMWLHGQGFPKAKSIKAEGFDGWKTPSLKPAWEPVLMFRAPRQGLTYDACALRFGSGALNVDAGRIAIDLEMDASQLRTINRNRRTEDSSGQKWGMTKSNGDTPQVIKPEGRYPANAMLDEETGEMLGEKSRFFYVAKASIREKNAGLSGNNDHPTIKPIELNRWLASLLLPPNSVKPRRLLVPFSGVASEMIGALLAGWDEVVGVEKDAE